MLLSPIVTGHCQGQLLSLWQNPIPCCLRGYHPLCQHVPEHFSSGNSIQRHSTPHPCHVAVAGSVWALPFSLAATSGISIDFSSSSYSDASLRTVRPPRRKRGSVKRDLIRKSWDQRSHAPTPSLSQLATSFITYQAESSSNRRLCTCTPANTIAAPETLRERFRKATCVSTYSVVDLWRVSVSCARRSSQISLLRPSPRTHARSCISRSYVHSHNSADPLHSSRPADN